jgi:hypothetical protein
VTEYIDRHDCGRNHQGTGNLLERLRQPADRSPDAIQCPAGDRILAANRAIAAATGDVKLWAGEKWVETPRKTGLDWTEDLTAYARTSPSGTPLVRLTIRFLKVNDTAIWSAPVEMFCEISMNVRNQSPFAKGFYFGYTNGWIGYLPTEAGFAKAGMSQPLPFSATKLSGTSPRRSYCTSKQCCKVKHRQARRDIEGRALFRARLFVASRMDKDCTGSVANSGC